MEPLRTIMFVPGNRLNFIEKARTLPADVLCLDLEDSVPFGEKAAAREIVKDNIDGMARRGQKVYVRINSGSTGLHRDDLKAVVCQSLDGISVGKAESPDEMLELDIIIQMLERARGLPTGQVKIIPWVETAMGVTRAYEIARATRRIVGIAFGAEDFCLSMGIERTKEAAEQFYARAAVAIAARAAEVLAIDTPYGDFRDEEGLIRDAKAARQLGFKGKFCIHPTQVEVVNNIFSPSEEEVAYSRRVVEAFNAAMALGHASTSIDGKMIDVPVAERAKKLLELAEAIARRDRR
ncbi:MAG: CoA ester lyase [Chloroflexi bacterium]|nr:CoA ester lyase [Chloroflexota bacterium]